VRVVSLPDAIEAVASVAPAVRSEPCATQDALGRTLAEPLVSVTALPRSDVAAMDGYAVRSIDAMHVTEDAPARLRQVGGSFAGQPFGGVVREGEAVMIATGASLPEGADAIVVAEDAESEGELVVIRAPATAKHIRRVGEDLAAGVTRLDEGERMTPTLVSLAAAMGHAVIPVVVKPKVAILVTGEEVDSAGDRDGVFDSNGPLLKAMLTHLGAEVVFQERVGDTADALASALNRASASEPDLIVSTGGASVGKFDLVRRTMKPLERGFERTAVKPGGPVMLGRHGDTPWLGLPGTPVAVAVVGGLLLASWAHAALGLAAASPWEQSQFALAVRDVRSDPSKTALWLARSTRNERGQTLVEEVGIAGESRFWSLRRANCLIVMAPEEVRRAGDCVKIVPMEWNGG